MGIYDSWYANDLAEKKRKRDARQNQAAYGQNSRSGGYGYSSYGFKPAEFDGQPAVKRTRDDGALEFFYGLQPGQTGVNLNDSEHGHAVIKQGKLVYKRRPGEVDPVVDRG